MGRWRGGGEEGREKEKVEVGERRRGGKSGVLPEFFFKEKEQGRTYGTYREKRKRRTKNGRIYVSKIDIVISLLL